MSKKYIMVRDWEIVKKTVRVHDGNILCDLYIDHYAKYFRLVDPELTDSMYYENMYCKYLADDEEYDEEFCQDHDVMLKVNEENPEDDMVIIVIYKGKCYDFYLKRVTKNFPVYEVFDLID